MSEMCAIMQEIKEEGREEGREEGKTEIVMRMYEDGSLDIKGACTYLECTQEKFFEYVEVWKNK